MRTAVVVVGAGASCDAADAGARVLEEWRPPLVRDLFDVVARSQYGEFLESFPGAQFLAHRLAEEAKRSTFSLEQELRRLSAHPDLRMRRNYMDIPLYLAGLFGRISRSFTPSPGSYCRLVQDLLAETPHHLAFVSLNYDDLLERALIQFHHRTYRFASMDDYCAPSRQAIVVKPHGSANWRRPCSVSEKASRFGPVGMITFPPGGAEITVNDGVQHGGRITIYPALAAPLASKSGEDFVCPSNHVEALRVSCRQARKLLFIGTSCLDDDVLALLGKECPRPELLQVVIKGNEEDGNVIADRLRPHWPFLRPPQLEIFLHGFRAYLASERLQWFVQSGDEG